MNTNTQLHLVCPPPMRSRALLIGAVLTTFLLFVLVRNADQLFTLQWGSLGKLLVIALMLTVVGAVVYRNLFFRETLVVFKNGAAAPAGTFAIAAEELLAVTVADAPAPLSYDGKMAALGLGRGMLRLCTASEEFYFGVGLSVDQARRMQQHIAAFQAGQAAA